MGNEEYLDILRELYKFLRDKISISLKEFLSDDAKEKLYSFDIDNILLKKLENNKAIEYSSEDNKIYVNTDFLTPEYIEKVKEKNPEFDLVDLKTRINDENPKVLLEEFIAFSSELNITEKDIVKSLFIQRILEMILFNPDREERENVIISGTLELIAHTLGSQNGFLVGTPKKYLGDLEVAIGLKEELGDDFERIILGGKILEYLPRIENKRLFMKLDELTNDRIIIESTQDLDSVIKSVVNEEIKEEVDKMKEEEIINIDTESNAPSEPVKVELEERPVVEEVKQEMPSNAVNEINNVEQNNVLEQPQQQVIPQENVTMPIDNPVNPMSAENVNNVENSIPEVKNNSKKKILTIVVIVLTVALGILVGWLLFNLSQS